MRLPAAYAIVVALARGFDEIVQAGSITNKKLLAVHSSLGQLLLTVISTASSASNTPLVLHRLIPSAGMAAMKATDSSEIVRRNPVADGT